MPASRRHQRMTQLCATVAILVTPFVTLKISQTDLNKTYRAIPLASLTWRTWHMAGGALVLCLISAEMMLASTNALQLGGLTRDLSVKAVIESRPLLTEGTYGLFENTCLLQ